MLTSIAHLQYTKFMCVVSARTPISRTRVKRDIIQVESSQ